MIFSFSFQTNLHASVFFGGWRGLGRAIRSFVRSSVLGPEAREGSEGAEPLDTTQKLSLKGCLRSGGCAVPKCEFLNSFKSVAFLITDDHEFFPSSRATQRRNFVVVIVVLPAVVG